MGGKKKRGGAKAKAPPKDFSDMLNPPESKEDYVEELDDLDLSDDHTDQPLVSPPHPPLVSPPHPPLVTPPHPPQDEEVSTPVALLEVSATTVMSL